MTPKKLKKEDISNNANLHTSIQIGGDKMDKEDYKSVYDSNYGNKNLLDGKYYILMELNNLIKIRILNYYKVKAIIKRQ